MPETNTIKTIARGGILFTAGKFGATFLQFFSGLIIIHAIDKAEYGLVSLGQVWMTIAITISSLGMGSGLPRIIAHYAAKKTREEMDSVLSASLFLVTGVSLVIWAGFLGYAVWIKTQNGPGQNFSLVLIFFSFLILPTTLINTLCALFRGFEKIEPEVIYNSIVPNILKIILLGAALLMGMALKGVLAAQVLTLWFSLFLLIPYASRRMIKNLVVKNLLPFFREVFIFSLPFMGIQVMGQLLNWIPMLFLGHFHMPEEIGVFNAPSRLTILFPIPLLAVSTLYLPIATRHYEENQIEKIKPLYVTATKWSFFLTLPVSLFAILDSSFVTTTLFGKTYTDAAPVLMGLSIAALIHSFFGPNGVTLISCGAQKSVFWSTTLGTGVMTALSLILIPASGAWGASIAYGIAIAVSNGCISFILYRYYRIHPFKGHYLKPLLLTFFVAIMGYFMLSASENPSWYVHMVYLLTLLMAAFFSPLFTGSLSQDDRDLLNLVKKRIGQKKRDSGKKDPDGR